MSIQTEQVITSADLKTLMNNLITLYNNRTLWLKEMEHVQNSDGQWVQNTLDYRSFYINSIPDSENPGELIEVDIESGSPITKKTLGNLIRKVLVINDVGKLKDAFYTEPYMSQDGLLAFYNGNTVQDLITWSNEHKNAVGNSTAHGCRGACVGICTGGCHGQGKGRTGYSTGSWESAASWWTNSMPANACSGCSTKCTTKCGLACTGTCYGAANNEATVCRGCGTTCSKGCANKCTTSCIGCDGNCKGDCSGSCNNECRGNCNGCRDTCGSSCSGCGSGCSTLCAGKCVGACQDECVGGCAVDCNFSCFGGCTSSAQYDAYIYTST